MGFSARMFEVVLYPESFDMSLLSGMLEEHESSIQHWAYCIHNMDEGKKTHVHLAIRVWNPWKSDNICKWFGIGGNQIEKCKGRWADMLAYLTHQNAPEKFQYPPECVVSNFDWQDEAKKAGKKESSVQRCAEIVEKIASGEIRQYNFHDHIPIDEYIRWKRPIDTAFAYRLQMVKGVHRKMECYFITGPSGAGKTSFAKMKAEEMGMAAFVSSGSNDVLDGYQGQECIILDDLRPSSMGLSDLLKMLDPHTASTVKSRYYNKVLECRLIIITTTLDIETFFHNVFQDEPESIIQLKRRCRLLVEMNQEEISIKIWMDKSRRYGKPFTFPNVVLAQMGVRDYTPDEELEMVQKLMGSAANFVEEIRKNGKDYIPDSETAKEIVSVFGRVEDVTKKTLSPLTKKAPKSSTATFPPK